MIRPQLDGNGLAIRLPIAERATPLVDDLSLAYAEDPDIVGRLLCDHAEKVGRLDHAAARLDMPEHVRAMRAAEADGTREALLAETESADRLDDLLSPDQAISLASRLTHLAAHIRHTSNRRTRP
ncbi:MULTISPECIES: hypothetical protein [unclassified Streptomyces]|uniref:Uncharacterized protein n=1 Tax=Streptomyces sp. NBC_00060 TaxID=2975636 RepID=A0AAU2H717_9ACTN